VGQCFLWSPSLCSDEWLVMRVVTESSTCLLNCYVSVAFWIYCELNRYTVLFYFLITTHYKQPQVPCTYSVTFFIFRWPGCCSYPRHKFPKECGSCVSSPSCTSLLQPLDHGISRSFKHYHCKQLVRKIICDWLQVASWCNTHEGKCSGCTTFHCGIMAPCHTFDNNSELFLGMWIQFKSDRWWCRCNRP
jgi:hypothetical protein